MPWSAGLSHPNPKASCGIYDSDAEIVFYMNKMMKTDEDTVVFCKTWIDGWNTREQFQELIGAKKSIR